MRPESKGLEGPDVGEGRQVNHGQDTAPIVSVCMITYNHRPFLEQALESVLMQEASFPFEILLRLMPV